MQRNDTLAPPLANRIPDACARLGIGKSILYELIASGDIRSFKIGNRTLIAETELQRFIDARTSAAA